MIPPPAAPWTLGELLGEEFGSAWHRARFKGDDALVRVFDGAYDEEHIVMRIAEDGWLGEELRHPGLLAILATDRLAYAIPYFEGWTVQSLVPLSMPAALAVARGTCDVLHYLLTRAGARRPLRVDGRAARGARLSRGRPGPRRQVDAARRGARERRHLAPSALFTCALARALAAVTGIVLLAVTPGRRGARRL